MINLATNAATVLGLGLGAVPSAIAVNSLTDKTYVVNGTWNSVLVIDGAASPTAMRPALQQGKPALGMGYNGTLAVYSLNGRLVQKTAFAASAIKADLLQAAQKGRVGRGAYYYCIMKDNKVMDKGKFMVK